MAAGSFWKQDHGMVFFQAICYRPESFWASSIAINGNDINVIKYVSEYWETK
jgi:hypothetical protein